MTIRHKLDPAEAALISENIRDMLSFLGEIIEDPARADHIPIGSTLDFRIIRLRDKRVRLTAFRPSGSEAPWSARVTTRTAWNDEVAVTSPNRAPAMDDIVTTGATADEALDALEAALRTHAQQTDYARPARQRQ